MTILSDLGFAAASTFACEGLPDARLLVPATVAGAEVALVVDSALDAVLGLDLAYAESRRFELESTRDNPIGIAGLPPKRVASAPVPHVAFLDHNYWGESAHAVERSRWQGQAPSGRPVVGAVGSRFLSQYRFAFDSANQIIAFADSEPAPLAAAGARLALIALPERRVAFTPGVRFPTRAQAPGPILVLDTGADRCAITREYLMEHVRLRALGRSLLVALARRAWGDRGGLILDVSPWPDTVRTARFLMVPSMQSYAKPFGLDRVDGWLGIPFLRHWCCVFDHPHNQVLLIDSSSCSS